MLAFTVAPGDNAPVQPAPTPPANAVASPNGSVHIDPTIDPGTPPVSDPNRPAWLPAKFKNEAEFAKAYAELEKKLGSTPPADPATPPADTPPNPADTPGINFPALEAEFLKDGKLSEASLKKLKEVGISDKDVALYVEGRKSEAAAMSRAVASVAGGEDKMNSVLEWAVANLPKAEQDAYNAAVDSGDVARAEQAFGGVLAKYAAANPAEPALISAQNPSVTVPQYSSWAEVTKDMEHPTYPKDAAFRARVAARLAASDTSRFTY